MFMSQTVQSPVQLTLEAIVAKFRESYPSFVEPFERLKPELEAGTGAQSLANLINCEVTRRDEQGLSVYSWVGTKGPFELRVPKPFDPHPQRPGEQQQIQMQMQQEAPEPHEDTLEPSEAASPAEEAPETVGGTTTGLFTGLADLLGDSNLLMTVAKTSEEGNEPVLTVTVVPQGEGEAFTPICLEGTVSDLDAHFVSAVQGKAQRRKDFLAQLEALEAADKELEEAKKKEAEAKRKQADTKKKAAEKKDEQGHAEEKKAERQQEALF